jgi:hypothetical protein
MAVTCMSVGGRHKLFAFNFEENPVRNGGVFYVLYRLLQFLPCYRRGQFAAREQEGGSLFTGPSCLRAADFPPL